jgi:hypothetical protein
MAISSPEMMLVPMYLRQYMPSDAWSKAVIHTEVDVTKRTRTDLAANTVLIADPEILLAMLATSYRTVTVLA